VVAFSVIVQGGTVPWLLRRLRIPLRTIEPEPWSLGIRFQHEPEGLHRFVVARGAAADTTPVGDLAITEDAWISLLIRDGGWSRSGPTPCCGRATRPWCCPAIPTRPG
jgi:potassium/hydrogen antiporter